MQSPLSPKVYAMPTGRLRISSRCECPTRNSEHTRPKPPVLGDDFFVFFGFVILLSVFLTTYD